MTKKRIAPTSLFFLRIFLIALLCVFTGGLIGAITNMINGYVSPYYFKSIMYWDFEDIWIASVAQGIFEGLVYGLFFALVFTTAYALITNGKSTIKFALTQLIKVSIIVLISWVIGGLLAIALSALSPDFYRAHFHMAPDDNFELIKFAWVGGSIWGSMAGGLLSSVLGIVIIKSSWKKYIKTIED